jgi:parvulin-like peptidyl-prolyl isomerase
MGARGRAWWLVVALVIVSTGAGCAGQGQGVAGTTVATVAATEAAPGETPATLAVTSETPTMVPATPEPGTAPPPGQAEPPAAGEEDEAAATVNGVAISRATVATRVAQSERALVETMGEGELSAEEQQGALERARDQVLQELIDEALIRQGAMVRGLSVSDEAVAAALAQEVSQQGGQAAFDGWLAQQSLTLAAYRETVRFQLLTAALREAITAEVPTQQEQRQVRHILSASRAEAEAVLAQLQAGGDFATLARTHSIDPGTREQGGELGFIPRGLFEGSLDEAIWALGPGETSGVVESDFGFHVVQVVAVDPQRAVALPVWQVLQERAFDRWLTEQRQQATITEAAP